MRGHFGYDSFEFPSRFGPWDRGFECGGRDRPPFGMRGWSDHRRPHGPPGFHHSPDLFGMAQPSWPPCAPPPPGCPPPPVDEAHQRCHDERHGMPYHERHDRPGCGNHEPSEDQYRSPGCGCRGPPEGHGSRGPCGPSRHPRDLEDSNETSENHQSKGCERRGPSQVCERRGPSQGCKRRGPPGPPRDHHGPPEHGNHGPRDHNNDCCDRGYEHHGYEHGHRFGSHNPHHRHGDERGWSNYFDRQGFGFGPHFGRRHECHRRPGPYDRPGGCPGRDREDCQNGRCCSKNKENQVSNQNKCGRRDGDQCGRKNKDRNQTENAVLIQRIVVETAPTRPQSV